MDWTTGIRFLAGARKTICLFVIASSLALGSTQSLNQGVPVAFPRG